MRGIIDISSLYSMPEKLEYETAVFLADLGKDITFIRPSYVPDQHRPDILMDGIEWEIKCPIGNSQRTLEMKIRKALKQSQNIIMDLRNIKLDESKAIAKLENEFKHQVKIKRMCIIKKDGILIEYKK